MNATASPAATTRPAPAALQPPAPFTKPSPGSWMLDAAHCERPLPRFLQEMFATTLSRGFREGLVAYGALLDGIDATMINGFLYACMRPFGAPPEPKGLPPKFIFKSLTTLHPEIRRRVKRSQEAMESKLWRTELKQYQEEWSPPIDRARAELLDVDVEQLDDAALADHIAACFSHSTDAFHVHHRMNCSRVIPVGEFIANAREWTGASLSEILAVLRGSSPASREGHAELDALVIAIRADESARVQVTTSDDAGALIDALANRGDEIGIAASSWLKKIGHHVTGFSPGYPTLRETPTVLVEALRSALIGNKSDDAGIAGRRSLEALRNRVPAEHRAAFDSSFTEAQALYFMRDHACMKSLSTCGIMRIAYREAGRRLELRGLVHDAEAALEATVDEIRSLLLSGTGPTRDVLQKHLAWREYATSDNVPELLGPPPSPPPPDDWLPVGAQRLQRAIGAYLVAMSHESDGKGNEAKLVRGLAASGGKRTGTARLVLEPGDFDRIREGDVLVARITSPSYNVLLPLLAGIVTDRGGVLSHPAIVSREYGIPGVVGTRNATSMIPDGATVEIDGDAGTVRVLS
ncbi:MAG: hypothetical protein H7X80_05100 [bacterium]|nr:hypothetical protein [Candidatus Kapabacteria bacterium]